MRPLNSPTIENPKILIPVHPAIEDYMRGISRRTDDPVLIEMERVAQENNFPIVGRLVGIFLRQWQSQLMLVVYLSLEADMAIQPTGLQERWGQKDK